MQVNEVEKMFEARGLNTYPMKKAEMIRAMQRKEKKADCFRTARSHGCREFDCLWWNDCTAHRGDH